MRYVNLLMYTPARPEPETPDGEAWTRDIFAWYAEHASQVVDRGVKLQDADAAKTVRDGAIVDGPYMEAKEVIGGYSITEADSMDAAVQLAQSWPGVDRGWIVIEVRPVDEI